MKKLFSDAWAWMKAASKSRTIIFALVVMAFGVIHASLPVVQHLVSPSLYGFLTVGIGMLVGVLRVVTTMPVTEKKTKK